MKSKILSENELFQYDDFAPLIMIRHSMKMFASAVLRLCVLSYSKHSSSVTGYPLVYWECYRAATNEKCQELSSFTLKSFVHCAGGPVVMRSDNVFDAERPAAVS